MKELTKYTNKMFEDIKHVDENGNEYWLARELQKVFEYTEWRKFNGVIDKAKEACKKLNIEVKEQLVGADKLSNRANNTVVKIQDYRLSRYACYLIAQNGVGKMVNIGSKTSRRIVDYKLSRYACYLKV